MATTILPIDNFQTNIDDMRLEIFCIVWLNPNVNVEGFRGAEQKLRSIINHLKKFQDVEQCRQFIEQRSQNDRLVLIVSGRLGREIVPSIHRLRQVTSIYVYCLDKQSNEQWARQFRKVKAVIVELDELVSCIKADHKIQKKVEEPLSINIYTTASDAGKSTSGVNGDFVFSQVLIDCLLRLKSTEADKKELIKYCKNIYEGNDFELDNLHEFKKDYSSDKILWWYTRESFFYKTLNAALRKQNIHMIFLFRRFISDIHCELKKHSFKHSLRVYRGQMISSNELEILKQCLGQFISVNSFFSTTTDYQQARSFLNVLDSTDNLQAVLFEIHADPKLVTSKPFADISAHSDYKNESEVLFMLGSIFRLKSVSRSSDNQIWTIRMDLCSENEHDLEHVVMHMKKQLGDGETNLRTLGKILCKMGKFDLAEQYFTRLLKELSPDDSLLRKLYKELGELASQTGNYDKSVQWHKKALAFKNTNQVMDATDINKQSYYILIPKISPHARWVYNGVTVAGGYGKGIATFQLNWPRSLYIDDDQTMYIADTFNHRILRWKIGDTNGQVVAGGLGQGYLLSQLDQPTDVLIDKETDSLIISDRGNRRVMRWSCRSGTTQGEILIDNIGCWGLAFDHQRFLYISDTDKHEVRRYRIGEKSKNIVAGGHGQGDDLNQFSWPFFVFVDEQQAVYVSDNHNNRVMKWNKGAKEGVIVAGNQGEGQTMAQLSRPNGLFVDTLGTVYVVDWGNNRVLRWPQEAKQGTVIVAGNGKGQGSNQLNWPRGLSYDRHGHLYVTDCDNQRVQRFSLEWTH